MVDQKGIDMIRKGMKNARIVMTDDGKIFAATLDNIKKHNYRLVEDVPKSEFFDPNVSEAERKLLEKTRKAIIEFNAILESGGNEIER